MSAMSQDVEQVSSVHPRTEVILPSPWEQCVVGHWGEVGVPDQSGKVVCKESFGAISGLPYWLLPRHICGNLSPPQPGVHVVATVHQHTASLHCARGTPILIWHEYNLCHIAKGVRKQLLAIGKPE
ncbi:unnamed protein product, partial [Coregonus sp. 'balchen']